MLVTPVALLSGMARFAVTLFSPLKVIDQELNVPTSAAARSCTLSFQAPAVFLPLNTLRAWAEVVTIENVVVTLSAEEPVRLWRIALVLSGPVRVTTRSPL